MSAIYHLFDMSISTSSHTLPSIGIIGAGKLGSALSIAFGKQLQWIVCHTVIQAEELRNSFPDIPIYTSIGQITSTCDVVFLTVPDGRIKETAENFSITLGDTFHGKMIVHCSGALGLDELNSCRELGIKTIASHPYQTFTGKDSTALKGIAWGIECEKEDEDSINGLVTSLGGIPVILSAATKANKAVYHASAVVASNFVTTLVEVAREFAAKAGINDVFLAPIIRRAVENSLEALHLDAPLPLTGPIARADITTLELHRKALANTPLWELYSILSRATAITAFRNDIITAEEYELVKNVVKE